MSNHATVAKLFAVLAVGFVLVALIQGEPMPTTHNNTTLGDEQRQYESNNPDIDTGSGILASFACLGEVAALQPLFFDAPNCQRAGTYLSGLLEDTGVGKAIVTTIEGLQGFIRLLADVMTFNVPNAPNWIRFAFSFTLAGISSYITLSLIRGGS